VENTVAIDEHTGWTREAPPANTWWSQATAVRYAFAFHVRDVTPHFGSGTGTEPPPAAMPFETTTGPRCAYSDWFELSGERWRPTLRIETTATSYNVDKVVVWRQFRLPNKSRQTTLVAEQPVVNPNPRELTFPVSCEVVDTHTANRV
jgi:hypothetical protein